MTASRMLPRKRSLLLGAGLMLALVLLVAPRPAHAGPLVASAPDCEQQSLSQPFVPWVDPASYQLAPDGGFEAGGDGWRLDGGVAVDGNESFYVRDGGDSRALRVPGDGFATSPTVCVGLEHPTLRFFAKKTGGALATMAVKVRFEDSAGDVHSLPIGTVAGAGSWQPTVPMPIGANLLPLLPGEYTPVRFRFIPVSGDWKIDDVYVDPFRH